MYSKNVWNKYESHEEIMKFAEDYKAFISKGKTERLCVEESVRLAKEKGYVDNDWEYQFSLSPNDLVYVPAINEIVDENNLDKSRVYKMVSSSGNQCFFVLSTVSKSIVDKKEYSPLNKMENAISGEQIKKVCLPLIIDRLGNIKLKK